MLWRVTLPVLSPMILAVAVLSFIRGLQSFNTELLLGTPAGIYVYSTQIYDYMQREPRFLRRSDGAGLGLFVGARRAAVFLLALSSRQASNLPWSPGQGYSTLTVKLGKWRYVALAGAFFTSPS